MKKLFKRWRVVALYEGAQAKGMAKCLKRNLSNDLYWNKYKVIRFGVIKKGLFAVIERPRKNFII